MRKIHERVRGTDPVTGQPYAAGDPALLIWVHAALVDSVPGRRGPVRRPRSARRTRIAYVAEMTAAAEIIGIRR